MNLTVNNIRYYNCRKLVRIIKQNYDRKEDKAMKHRVNTNKRRTSIDFQRFE